MLSGGEGFGSPFKVQVVRGGDVDDVDGGIVEQGLVGAVRFLDLVLLGFALGGC